MIKLTSKLKYKNRYYSSIRLYVMQGGRACFGPIVISVKVLITGQGIDNHRPFIVYLHEWGKDYNESD